MEEQPTTAQRVNKTADKKKYAREYMREYYRKKRVEEPEKIRALANTYQRKYKYDLPIDDVHKYGTALPIVDKIRKQFAKLQAVNPDLVKMIIQEYSAA